MNETRQRKGPERLAVVRHDDGTEEIASVSTTRTDWKATAGDRLQTIAAQTARIEALEKALEQVQAMYIEDEYEPVRICRQWVEPALRQGQPASEGEA